MALLDAGEGILGHRGENGPRDWSPLLGNEVLLGNLV